MDKRAWAGQAAGASGLGRPLGAARGPFQGGSGGPDEQPAARRPECWVADGGSAAEVVLSIPADLQRERRFEIACAMTVRCPDDLADRRPDAWHEMTVLANGAQQWRRRIATQNPGAFDGLDYRFARVLLPGEALKVLVRCEVAGARRERLLVEADEVLEAP